jgi:hypothetical protein
MSKQFVAKTAKRLIRRYGAVVDLYSVTEFTTDRDTGIRQRTTTKITFTGLVFESAEQFNEYYDTFHNKNTEAANGFIKTVDRVILVTKKALGTWEPSLKNYVLYGGRKYEIVKVHEYDPSAYLFFIKSTPGDTFNVIISEVVYQFIDAANSGDPTIDTADIDRLALTSEYVEDPSLYELFLQEV